MTKEASKKNILEKVKENHLWLNAISCINPTDDFKKQVGEQILDMLNEKNSLLTNGINDLLYIKINKS